MLKFLCVIQDLADNNYNSIANCIFYLTKNLKMAQNLSQNMLNETM